MSSFGSGHATFPAPGRYPPHAAPLLFLLALIHRDLKPGNIDELAELLEEWEAEAKG